MCGKARERERERVRVGKRWSAPRREREKERNGRKRRWRVKVGPRNNHVRGALLISAFVHLRPPPGDS